jgi:hypothetical protein
MFQHFFDNVKHTFKKFQLMCNTLVCFLRRYDMNGIFQMQGGKNWIFPIEMNANQFFWDSHWLKIWPNHFCLSMGPNGGSVAMDPVDLECTFHIFSLTDFCHISNTTYKIWNILMHVPYTFSILSF